MTGADDTSPPATPPQDLLAELVANAPSPKSPHPGLFLKGPIPWVWLGKAMALPGKALHVGVVIWFQVGLQKTDNVKLSFSLLGHAGISRWSASRGLLSLKDAGLVEVDRAVGRKPRVRVVRPD